MQKSEYRNIFQNESEHFYYTGTHQTTVKLLKKYLIKDDHLNILDAGCGTGLLLKKLSSFGKTWGVDLSEEALRFAHKRKLKRLFLGSVTSLPFKKNTFDVIVCIDVLYHRRVSEDTKALSEFYRVLKPGGILILKVPAYQWLRGNHDIIAQTKHRYTKSEVTQKLKRANLDILKISYANSYILPLALFKRFILDNFFAVNPISDVQKLPNSINKLLTFINTVENQFLNFFNLPFGLSIYSVSRKSSLR